MHTPATALALVVVLAGSSTGPLPGARPQLPGAPTIADLRFMTGCWRGASGRGGVIDEYYTPPSDNLMLGVSRFSKAGRVTSYEFTTIAARGDSGVVLTARPSTQPPADFRLARLEPGLAVWSNPRHDFPQVISYRRVAADSLAARIQGPSPEGTRSSEWRMGRVSCTGES